MAENIVCRCEEVAESEILEAICAGARTLNEVKRRTRAGMGVCQGKSCQRMIARLLAQHLGCDPADIAPPSVRPPTRPLPLAVFLDETTP